MTYDEVLADLEAQAAKHGLSEADMRMLASDIAGHAVRADSAAAPERNPYRFLCTGEERDAVQALLARMRGMA